MALYKPHGKHKPKSVIDIYTLKKRKRIPKITLKLVIKSQETKRRKKTLSNKPIQNN